MAVSHFESKKIPNSNQLTNQFEIGISLNTNKIKRINFCRIVSDKNYVIFLKEGLASIKAFFSSPNENVHSELYTFPLNLTAEVRGCVREKVNSKKKR